MCGERDTHGFPGVYADLIAATIRLAHRLGGDDDDVVALARRGLAATERSLRLHA